MTKIQRYRDKRCPAAKRKEEQDEKETEKNSCSAACDFMFSDVSDVCIRVG